jgi:hypothetical protein
MMLVLSVLLALVPLLGVAWIVMNGLVTTVDGLFMSLILLAMSGIVGLNVLLELRKRGTGAAKPKFSGAVATASGRLTQRGKVESVQFYESGVGEPNKRNALPVGQKVEVTFRKESGHNVLMNVDYP